MPSRAALVSSIIRPRPLPSDGPASSLASPESRNASASTNSISPEATERVPSLSFSRRTRTPLREPSRRVRSTRKVATPRLESGAPSGLASTTNASPLQFDANHLNPLSSHASPLRVAVVSSAPRSDPPVRSVSSWAVSPSHSPDSNLASTWSRTSGGAYAATNAFTMPPPVPSAQPIPMSAWLSR